MKMTLKEAADAVGRNKSTLFRAIQDGKLKATKNENGLIFIEPEDLMATYPPEDPETRMQTRKRGRPAGSKKKKDGDKSHILAQEFLRIEKVNHDFREELETLRARTKADELRISDLMIERERLTGRVSHLERELDMVRAESAAKDGRIYDLRAEKDKVSVRLDSMERNMEQLTQSTQDLNKESSKAEKKGILEKFFA